MELFVVFGVVGLIFILLYIISPLISPDHLQLRGAHVLITGGSSGIGKAVAVEVVKRGASVTLLARDQRKLSDTKQQLEQLITDQDKQKVFCVSADLSGSYDSVEKAISLAEGTVGPVDVLVNSAGFSVSQKFEDIPLESFKTLMDVNYHGSVYACRAVVPSMKRRARGRIILVSSQAGQLGLFGFTAYSACKFALRGFAEALQMEVKPYNIRVCVAYPPDTDTPGYEEEMKTKPKETRLISESGGLYQADYVARSIVDATVKGSFSCYMGVDGFMLSSLTSGMSPVISITEAVQQIFTVGIFRAISLVYLAYFDRIVRRCGQESVERSALLDKDKTQ